MYRKYYIRAQYIYICLLFKSLTMKVFVNLNFKIHHKFSKRLVFSIFSAFQIIYTKTKRVVLCNNFVALKLTSFVCFYYSIFR